MNKKNNDNLIQRWYDDVDDWDEFPSFKEGERIPKLKEFIMKLYLSDEWKQKEFHKEIYKLKRKLDQILRNQFNLFFDFSNTEIKDIDSLLPDFNTSSLNNYFDKKLSEGKKELVILIGIRNIIMSLKKQHKQDIILSYVRDKVKREEDIINKLKFPCKITFGNKKVVFKSREEFDDKVFYESNYSVIGKSPKEKSEMFDLINDFKKAEKGEK